MANPHPADLPRWQQGFTLIELMVTLVVMIVLMSLAVPSFVRLIAQNRLTTQTNEFIGTLHLARSEAVRRSQGVTLRASAGTLGDHSQGWRVFTDGDADGAAASPITTNPDDGTVLREYGALAGSTSIKRVTRSGSAPTFTYTDATASLADRMYVVFNSRGAKDTGTAAFFKVCDSANASIRGRIVQVSLVGKISLDSADATCP
jgi:type IV fimbrial biogenesis protein FimT